MPIDVPNRVANSNRKTSPPRSTPYETDSVAQQEGTRITRKGDPYTKVTPPSLKMVTPGRKHFSRSTIKPPSHALQILTDASKEGWGTHLGEQGEPGPFQKAILHINYLDL